MPAFFSHYRFGVHCYRQMQCGLVKEAVMEHPHAFCLGCQGPDLFFFHLTGYRTAASNYGHRLHEEQTGAVIHDLLWRARIAQGEDQKTMIAYTAGFLTHYLLDCHTHSYVYSVAGYQEGMRSMGKHFQLEKEIDLRLLLKLEAAQPLAYHPAQIVQLSKEEQLAVASLLSTVISDNLHVVLSKEKMKQILQEMVLVLRLLYDPHEIKGRVAAFAEKQIWGFPYGSPLLCNNITTSMHDPCNEEHRGWRHPFVENEWSEKSFFDLMRDAKREYLQLAPLLERVLSKKSDQTTEKTFEQLVGNRSYKSGQEVGQEDKNEFNSCKICS